MTTGLLPEQVSVAAPTVAAPGSERERCERLLRDMEQRRQPKIERWKDIEAFITPFSSNIDHARRAYDDEALNVLDESVLYARNTLANFLYAGMTNPARPWRQWILPDPDLQESQGAKEWLHGVNERQNLLLNRSNFYPVMAGVYDEWPSFATSVVLIEEDDADVFRYVHFGIGSYALADDAKGRCVAISRRFPMTVRQLVDRFARKDANGAPVRSDLSMFSRAVRADIEAGKWDVEHEVSHLIAPNAGYRPNGVLPHQWRWCSDYWESAAPRNEGKGGFLAREGYREWPAMVFRWKRIPGDPWGTDAPGYQTLALVKQLQQMQSDFNMIVEVQARPPIIKPTELNFVNLLPGAENEVDARSGLTVGPLHTTKPESVTVTAAAQEQMRQRLFLLWFTPSILAVTGQDAARQKTAREVEEISAEKLQVLGRVLEAATSAFQDGSDREFAIMARRGMLPPAPPEMEGRDLSIEYTSMLAMAMRGVGLNNLVEYAMVTAQIANLSQSPEVLRRTDWSQLAQEIGQRAGVPPQVQRSDEEVEAIVAAEQQAAAEQSRREQAVLEAKAAKDLGATPLGTGSALDAMRSALPSAGPGGLPS